MSHSRKHLTSATLNEFPVPAENEVICRVLRLMGNNNLEVQAAQGDKLIVTIPQKFNKVVWIGKGDYLIVDIDANFKKTNDSGTVHHVLYKDQIKHLVSQSLWPDSFPLNYEEKRQVSHNLLGDFDISSSLSEEEKAVRNNNDGDDDGNESDDEDSMEAKFVNPNHIGVAGESEEDEWSC